MSGIEVIENFLKEEDFKYLQKFFLSPRSQWRFIDFVVSREQDNQNKDGSERCLPFVRPRTFAFINHSTIRIAYDNWESQRLVSEIAHIVMKEIM